LALRLESHIRRSFETIILETNVELFISGTEAKLGRASSKSQKNKLFSKVEETNFVTVDGCSTKMAVL
jgi:hypothetical protein